MYVRGIQGRRWREGEGDGGRESTSRKTCLRDRSNFVAQTMFARPKTLNVAQMYFAQRNFARRRASSRKVLVPNEDCFTVFFRLCTMHA